MRARTPTTLAFAKFRLSLEQEIRMFWHLQASLEYATRYLEPHKSSAQRLSAFPGDNKNPFASVDVPPEEFLRDMLYIRNHLRENSIVSFITVFESYLFDLLQRLVVLQPL